MQTQLLEINGNLLEVPDQFQKCKKQNDKKKKKKVIAKQNSKIGKQSSEKHIKEKLSFNIKELEQVIKYREIKKSLLKEMTDDFEPFLKKKYSNQVWAAYQDLISDGSISANKREKVVNIVLTKIAGFLVHRLPNSTYAKDMGI